MNSSKIPNQFFEQSAALAGANEGIAKYRWISWQRCEIAHVSSSDIEELTNTVNFDHLKLADAGDDFSEIMKENVPLNANGDFNKTPHNSILTILSVLLLSAFSLTCTLVYELSNYRKYIQRFPWRIFYIELHSEDCVNERRLVYYRMLAILLTNMATFP